ncbi:hypothetical protein EBU94_07440 [bacterium]|nr:hypothetical protein [bacterium]
MDSLVWDGEGQRKEKPVRIVYNLEMAKAIRQLKPPVKGLIVDIMTRPNYLAVVVYESNIMEYNDSQREQIMNHLLMVRNVIQSYGTPCEIEGIKHDEQKRRGIRF